MSEQRPRRRRRRNRQAVIEEGGPDGVVETVEATDSASDAGKGATERRRGAKVQPPAEARPNTILGMPRFIFFVMAGLLVVIISTTIAGQLVNPSDDIEGVVEHADQGRRHLTAGETAALADYNSFPPTSGPQAADGVAPGIYAADAEEAAFQETPSFAALLPILEQGGVVIYYDPDRLSANDVRALRDVFTQPRREAGQDLLTLVELDSSLPAAIVATAWRHSLELTVLDEKSQDLLSIFADPDPLGLYQRFVLEAPPSDGATS